MFRSAEWLRCLFAFLTALLVLFASAHLCFPGTTATEKSLFIPLQPHIAHSPVSAHHFNRLAQQVKQPGTHRIIVLSDAADQQLADSLCNALRKAVDDPRLHVRWRWSNNWQRLRNSADGSCLLFRRPGKLVAPECKQTAHDYYEGWVSCSAPQLPTGCHLRLICRATGSECNAIFMADSTREVELPQGQWVSYKWPISHYTLLTLSGENSPEIGALAVEPENGCSIWNLTAPNCISNNLRDQAALLQPAAILVICSKSRCDQLLNTSRRLFPTAPLLLCLNQESVVTVNSLNNLRNSLTKHTASLLWLCSLQTTQQHTRQLCNALKPYLRTPEPEGPVH